MAKVPKALNHSVIRIWNELHFGVSFLVGGGMNERMKFPSKYLLLNDDCDDNKVIIISIIVINTLLR
jgi:hypothetical protein